MTWCTFFRCCRDKSDRRVIQDPTFAPKGIRAMKAPSKPPPLTLTDTAQSLEEIKDSASVKAPVGAMPIALSEADRGLTEVKLDFYNFTL